MRLLLLLLGHDRVIFESTAHFEFQFKSDFYLINFSNLLAGCIFRPALHVLHCCVFRPAFGWLVINWYILSQYHDLDCYSDHGYLSIGHSLTIWIPGKSSNQISLFWNWKPFLSYMYFWTIELKYYIGLYLNRALIGDCVKRHKQL